MSIDHSQEGICKVKTQEHVEIRSFCVQFGSNKTQMAESSNRKGGFDVGVGMGMLKKKQFL